MNDGHTKAMVEEPLLRPVMPELDTLRGIAILGVIFLHGFFWQYSGLRFGKWGAQFLNATQPGWLGVNLFFVLSGFLITGILIDSSGRPDYYRRFYTRRALRILPAYYALLVALWVMGATGAYVGLGFLYLANVTELFGVAQYYGPLWSLAVEEHFYLAWPAMVHRLSLRQVAMVAAGIVVLVPVLRGIGFRLGYTAGLASYTWFVVDGLACGALVAVLVRWGITRRQLWQVTGGLILGAIGLSAAGAPFGVLTRNSMLGAAFQHTLISMFFSGVLLAFLLLGTGEYRRVVCNSTLRFFGFISYGLYLVHLIMFRLYDKFCNRFDPALLPRNYHMELVLLRFVVAGGGAALLAFGSRVYFENWFLRLKDRMAASEGAPDQGLAVREG